MGVMKDNRGYERFLMTINTHIGAMASHMQMLSQRVLSLEKAVKSSSEIASKLDSINAINTQLTSHVVNNGSRVDNEFVQIKKDINSKFEDFEKVLNKLIEAQIQHAANINELVKTVMNKQPRESSLPSKPSPPDEREYDRKYREQIASIHEEIDPSEYVIQKDPHGEPIVLERKQPETETYEEQLNKLMSMESPPEPEKTDAMSYLLDQIKNNMESDAQSQDSNPNESKISKEELNRMTDFIKTALDKPAAPPMLDEPEMEEDKRKDEELNKLLDAKLEASSSSNIENEH
jgi:hypothetical protein